MEPAVKSQRFCRPLRRELEEIQALLPAARRFPLTNKRVKAITAASMYREWRFSSKPRARVLKPNAEICRYLMVDEKPTVCIRARLRLGVALTPHRRCVYGLTKSEACVCGYRVGDVRHVLLFCNQLNRWRRSCAAELRRLSPQAHISLHILFGGLPPSIRLTKGRARVLLDACIRTSGDFLLNIDRQLHL